MLKQQFVTNNERQALFDAHHPDLKKQLIAAFKEEKLPYVVAPFEADSQLASMNKNGAVDVVDTVDSDCIIVHTHTHTHTHTHAHTAGLQNSEQQVLQDHETQVPPAQSRPEM
jgi:5'-3' exonuclease